MVGERWAFWAYPNPLGQKPLGLTNLLGNSKQLGMFWVVLVKPQTIGATIITPASRTSLKQHSFLPPNQGNLKCPWAHAAGLVGVV